MKRSSKSSRNLTFNLTLSAIFAAIITVSIVVLRYPISYSTLGGYVHIGDTFIYLAAILLPLPYAIAAAAIGGALADLSVGALVYIIPTAIIKGCMCLFFINRDKTKKLLCKRNVIAVVVAGLLGSVGYYFTDVILLRNFISPLPTFVFGLTQPLASGILFVLIAGILDKRGLLLKYLKK